MEPEELEGSCKHPSSTSILCQPRGLSLSPHPAMACETCAQAPISTAAPALPEPRGVVVGQEEFTRAGSTGLQETTMAWVGWGGGSTCANKASEASR